MRCHWIRIGFWVIGFIGMVVKERLGVWHFTVLAGLFR